MQVRKQPAEWNVYRTRFLVQAKQLSRRLKFVDRLGREHRGKAGDYLVESCDGTLSIQPRKIFEDIYVLMGPAPSDNASVRDTLRKAPVSVRRAASGGVWSA